MNRRLLMLFATVLIAGCSTIPIGNPCAKYVPLSSSNRPIICVDDRNLSKLTSSPYEVWARRSSPIKWYTVSGQGGLTVSFLNEDCVKASEVYCRTGSNCEAKLTGAGSVGTQCKYSIALKRNDKTTTEDPIIIIDTGDYDPDQKD